jgi:probable rRNA maturation factor
MFKILIKAEARYPLDRKAIRDKVKEVLCQHGLNDDVVLDIAVVGDRKMAALNQKYRKQKGTTDVLSFPTLNYKNKEKETFVLPPDGLLHLGEIVISFPQARRQAMLYNHTVDKEINILVEHGLLHLLGINHEE